MTSNLLAGCFANVAGAVLNTPLDVVKSQIQRQTNKEKKFTGLAQGFVTIYKEEGPKAFLRGLG